jgi:hypothetical protein
LSDGSQTDRKPFAPISIKSFKVNSKSSNSTHMIETQNRELESRNGTSRWSNSDLNNAGHRKELYEQNDITENKLNLLKKIRD